jgi:iron(III) transport system ATP-binding protein
MMQTNDKGAVAEMNEVYLEIRKLTKEFTSDDLQEKVTAVKDFNLSIQKGEFITLLGPSGCGKTTTLRMVGGFEQPTAGDILLDGIRINDITANKRDTCMVFQSYALFPHMNLFKNVAYGLELKRRPQKVIKEKVEWILGLVGLENLVNRPVAQLSGGQQQRVALARAMVNEPKVLLFDEPLSNLDAKLRMQMRIFIRKIQQELNITSIYVTHDQEEAMTLSDRIVVMNRGQIEQVGTPEDIYGHPRSKFVADFIGKETNFLTGKVLENDSKKLRLNTLNKEFVIKQALPFLKEETVTLVVRPEMVELSVTDGDFAGEVNLVTYLGSEVYYEIGFNGEIFTVAVTNPLKHGRFHQGDKVYLNLDWSHIPIIKNSDCWPSVNIR